MFKALFRIVRPLNVFIAFLSVFFSAWLAVDFPFTGGIIRTALSAAMVTAAANVVNDIFDLEIDRVNKPRRPLPAGQLTVQTAWVFYGGLNVTALLLVADRKILLLIAAGAVILLYMYSKYLKRTFLWGNVLVSVLGGIAFLFGAVAAGNIRVAFFPALFAMLFHLARELIKDLEDVPGDSRHGARTLAVRHGARTLITVVDVVFLILGVILWLPFLGNLYNIYYICIVMPGVAGVLWICSRMLHKDAGRETLARISTVLKIDMFIGLAAMIIGVKL